MENHPTSWFAHPSGVQDLAQTVLAAALDALIVMDTRGVVVEWNPAATEIFGFDRSEAVGELIADLIIPDELREGHRAGLEHYLQSGEAPVFDRRVTMPALRADGSHLMVELAITPVVEAGTEFFTGWLRDITEIEEARATAARSTELLSAILQNVSDVITIFDADGTLKFASGGHDVEVLRSHFGTGPMSTLASLEDKPGVSVRSLLHHEDVERVQAIFRAIVDGRRPANERWDVRLREEDGVSRIFETTGQDLTDHPTVQGLIFSSRDVTQERNSRERFVAAETAARRLAEERSASLIEVAALKSELLAMVSHELRTPLTAILAYVDLLIVNTTIADAESDDSVAEDSQMSVAHQAMTEAVEMARVIERNAQLLTRLVDDLMLLGQLESGAIAIDTHDFEVPTFVERIEAGAAAEAAVAGVVVSAAVGEGPPVCADEGRITQVLQNLLSNAFKLAPAVARVDIEVELTPGGWRFSVSDDGPGIDADLHQQIFEKFFRGPQVGTTAGTGLGLAVSQAIVQMHGGEMTVASRVGHGACFSFTLPVGTV